MTMKEKTDILTLREAGRTLAQIAEEMNMPVNTVKSFLQRRRDSSGILPVYKPCLCCGRPVAQDPHRKEKKFCDAGCRVRWWNRNCSQSRGKAVSERNCAACGQAFRAYGARKYCSHACYIADRFGKGNA